MQRMSSRIRRNILIFTIWYIRIRFSEITTRLRRIFRWGKIDRRKQLLLPSAPDLPYNKALPELYDSAKSPEKPSVTRVSCPNGVKKSLPALYPKLVGMVAEAVGFEPTCPLGQPHFESFPAYAFWWKLSEYGSTQRKPKCCGILRILASAFRFYWNPPGFPSSSRFYPEL